MNEPATPEERRALADRVELWLSEQVDANPVVRDVENDPDSATRWFVRLIGDSKQGYTVVLDLGQRTLSYQTHFMPLPAENQAEVFEFLLRRNARMFGLAFVVAGDGPNDEGPAVYLRGRTSVRLLAVDLDGELDQIFGSIYRWVEESFQPAIRSAFASKFN